MDKTSNKGKTREELFAPKLTTRQKHEIFMEYVQLYTRKEQRAFAAQKAAELGVCRETIRRITGDKKRWDAYMKRCEDTRARELARAYAHLGDALDVPLSIIRDQEKYAGSGLVQYPMQAATDLMNRLNFKAETKESEGVTINFVGGGMPATNMPVRRNGEEA